jgi:tetratricopeptide (TPR) repeat protein
MSGDRSRRDARLAAAVLLLLVAAFHGPSLRNGFVYDDLWTIVDNPVLRRPSNALALLGPAPARALVPDAGRPTLLWSEMVDFALWGLAPWGYHLQNVAWHAGVVLLFFSATLALGVGVGTSLLAAALLAVHPLHVEVVAAVSYREDLLATFFGLLALALVIAARRRGEGEGRGEGLFAGLGLRAAATGAMLMGALAKESAALAPVVLLLLDACLPAAAACGAGARLTARLRDYVTLGVPAAGAFVWRAWVMGGPAVVSRAAEIPDAHRDRLVAVPAAAGHFLAACGQLLVPAGLKPDYDPELPSTAGARLLGWLALVVVAAAVVAAWRGRRRAPIPAFGVLAGVAAYLPHFGLVPLTNLRADRYLYAPSLPLTLALAVALVSALRCVDGGGRGAPAGRLSSASRTVLVAAILALGLRAWSQGRVWRHDLALWTYATRVAPASPRAWAARAAAHLRVGDTLRALEAARRSLALADDARTRQLVGLVLLAQGDVGGAHRELARAAREISGPGRAEALNNLGHSAHRLGRLEEALGHFRAAMALAPAPAFDRPWLNASRVHEERGELERAIDLVQELVTRAPDSADGWRRLGALLDKAGRPQEAQDARSRAQELGGLL